MKALLIICLLNFGSLVLQQSCRPAGNAKSKVPTAEDIDFPYNMASGRSYDMPKSLAEISGITFHPEASHLVYAIQDEEGILFTYDLSQKKVSDFFTFGKPGDYEDLVTDGKFFYILRSDGTLYSFPFRYTGQERQVKVFKALLPKGEYESLAIHPVDKKLYVLCKACSIDKKAGTLTGYSLLMDDAGNLKKDNQFSIIIESLQKLDPTVKNTIKPSAMTRRVSTNEWYVLSSIDKLIFVTDSAFRPKKIVRFLRKDFEQPEGIAFDQQENLFISSEAGKRDTGKIYRFTKK